jgi:glycosyltransferase involved in cell wall biosynthesis
MFDVPENVTFESRRNAVVFSSRWDTEKNPLFFLALAESFAKTRPDVEFIICTGLPALSSNDPAMLRALKDYQSRHRNLAVFEGVSKKEYFEILRSCKVQFNCASQDFVSYSLLDAMLNGCAPLYPDILTFPDALNRSQKNLYEARFESTSHVYLADAIAKLNVLLDSPVDDYSWVWKKYETSTKRKLGTMGFDMRMHTTPLLSFLNAMSVNEIKEYFAE